MLREKWLFERLRYIVRIHGMIPVYRFKNGDLRLLCYHSRQYEKFTKSAAAIIRVFSFNRTIWGNYRFQPVPTQEGVKNLTGKPIPEIAMYQYRKMDIARADIVDGYSVLGE